MEQLVLGLDHLGIDSDLDQLLQEKTPASLVI